MPVTRNYRGPEIIAAIKGRAGEAVGDVARRVLATATEHCPVDTGELRDSGHVIEDPNGIMAYVVYDAPHALMVEAGTLRMPARPFLSRAVLFERGDALATFKTIVGGRR